MAEKPGPCLASAQSSTHLSTQRFVEGWPLSQVSSHRKLFEAAAHAIHEFLCLAEGQAMHPDALRYWHYQRDTFLEQAQTLRERIETPTTRRAPMTEAELDEIALGSIKRLIAGKGASELIALRDELNHGLQSAVSGLALRPVGDAQRMAGEDGCIAIRNHIMQRRLEVNYLNRLLG